MSDAEKAKVLAASLAAARAATRVSGNKNSYRKDNPGEYAKVMAYLDGGARPTGELTKMGLHLVLEEDVRVTLTQSQSSNVGDYYVSPSGLDTNAGTSALPFLTIQKGLNVAQPGQTILVRPGTYAPATSVRSGTSGSPITLKAEFPAATAASGQHSTIVGGTFGVGTGLTVSGHDYLIIDGFSVSNWQYGIFLDGSSSPADHNIVRNNFAFGNDGAGITLYGGSFNLFERNFLQDLGPNPPGGDAPQDYGIALYGYGTPGASNRVVSNYFFGNHNQACSMKEQLLDFYVGYNTFEGAYTTALYLGQNDDNTGNNAPAGDATCIGGIAEYNVFRDATDTLSRYYRMNSVITIRNVQDVIVRYNYIENHEIYGVWVKPGTGSVVAGQTPHGAQIYGNTIVNQTHVSSARKAFRIEDRSHEGVTSDQIEIYNNTVYETDMGLSVVAGSSTQNILVKNNNFTNAGTTGAEGNLGETTLTTNNWSPQASAHGASDINVTPSMVGPFTPYNPSAVPGPTPVFTPVSSVAAYKLQVGSPLINAGTNVGLPFTGAAPDIGANEF